MVWQVLAAKALEKGMEKSGDASGSVEGSAQDSAPRSAGRDLTEQKQVTKGFTTGTKTFNLTGLNLGSILQPMEGDPATGGKGVPTPPPFPFKNTNMSAGGLSYEKSTMPQFDAKLAIPIVGMISLSLVLMGALRAARK